MSQDEMKSNVEQLARLQAGMEQARDDLEGINEEERLLEWEQSFFPQLQTMFQLKEPYDKLWNTAWTFHQKHEAWMNGIRVDLGMEIQWTRPQWACPCIQQCLKFLNTLSMYFDFFSSYLYCINKIKSEVTSLLRKMIFSITFVCTTDVQSTLVISTSVISNNRLSRRKNLVLVITQKSKIRL